LYVERSNWLPIHFTLCFRLWNIVTNTDQQRPKMLTTSSALANCNSWNLHINMTLVLFTDETTCNKCWTILRRCKNQTRHLGFFKVSSVRVRPIKKEKNRGIRKETKDFLGDPAELNPLRLSLTREIKYYIIV